MGDYTLVLGDCLEKMGDIPDGSVDAIVTDMPYNIGAAKWDYIENYDDFVRWCFLEFKRLSRQQVMFFDYSYTKLFEELEQPFERFIWHREGGYRGENIKKGYEPFYWYGKDVTYNRITEPNPYAKKDKRLKPERTVSNVWRIPNLVGRKKEATGHPTQKPINLMLRIIQMVTNPGDLVVDPFMGSGSTGEACLRTGRKFIGIEKDEGYYQIATNRLERVVKELSNQDLPLFATT